MLLWGTVNPDGESNAHRGVLLRDKDIEDLAASGCMIGKPVKMEHMGDAVGEVVSAWRHGRRLDCLLRIDRSNIEGVFAQHFVRTGVAKELSLGYQITMQNSADGGVEGGVKEVVEVSLVKKGARHECFIRGHTGK